LSFNANENISSSPPPKTSAKEICGRNMKLDKNLKVKERMIIHRLMENETQSLKTVAKGKEL
jgi:hypothetical protein